MQDLIRMPTRNAQTNRPDWLCAHATAGEVLDELGWLPPDLDAWALCPGCADRGGDLLAMKYPVTNHQFQRFIDADGYENYDYWGGEDSVAWRWRVKDHPDSRGEITVTEPRLWRDPRFGKSHRGYPVVGVSWYEAVAYAAWLNEQLKVEGFKLQVWHAGHLETFSLQPGTVSPRLPSEQEWERMAGGIASKERYPWDPPRSQLRARRRQ